MKKNQKIQFIFLCIMFILVVTNLALLAFFPSIYTILSFVLLIIIWFIGMHLIRSLLCKYRCPKCNHQFKINLIQDIFIRTVPSSGKNLVCPHCHEKNWMNEEN